MIITVTLNPAIDQTLELNALIPNSLNKVSRSHKDVGGKGINVSKVLKSLGTESLAMGFIGGETGDFIEKSLNSMGIMTDFIRVQGQTRTNLKIFDQTTKEITEINEMGSSVSEEALNQLMEQLKIHIVPGTLVVLSGSAPASLGSEVYSRMVEFCKENGADVFLDVDGDHFKVGLKSRPTFIKPNRDELTRYFGTPMDTEAQLLKAIDALTDMGIKHVFVSLGKMGGLYSSGKNVYRMSPLKVDAHSSVGAGDAFVGAVVHSMENHFDLEYMLKFAIATSAGAVMTIGTNPAGKEWIEEHVDSVKITKLR